MCFMETKFYFKEFAQLFKLPLVNAVPHQDSSVNSLPSEKWLPFVRRDQPTEITISIVRPVLRFVHWSLQFKIASK